jgi:hypothetical protein
MLLTSDSILFTEDSILFVEKPIDITLLSIVLTLASIVDTSNFTAKMFWLISLNSEESARTSFDQID